MSTKLFLIALTAFLGVSQFANAGVLMFVHFGDSIVSDLGGRQSTVDPGATRLTANIYMQLTEIAPSDRMTSIYSYLFSVRYNESLLDLDLDATGFIGFTETQDMYIRPKPFERTPNIPDFVAADFKSPIEDLFSNDSFRELRNFNGTVPGDGNVGGDVGPNFFRVASLDFVVDPGVTLMPGDRLIIAGKFYGTNDISIDGIGTEDGITYPIQSFGGSVSGGTVPEPSSILVFGSLGLCALTIRRLRNPLKR